MSRSLRQAGTIAGFVLAGAAFLFAMLTFALGGAYAPWLLALPLACLGMMALCFHLRPRARALRQAR